MFAFDGGEADALRPQKLVAKTEDERWGTNPQQRFELAPDTEDNDIEVVPRDMQAAVPVSSNNASSSVHPHHHLRSVGQDLMRSMSHEAKKSNPGAALNMLASSMQHVPTTVGGFLGAGGVMHKSADLDVGCIVMRNVAVPASVNGTASSSSKLSFKRDADISAEEATFGTGAITPATVGIVGQVLLVDNLKKECTIAHADGSKSIVPRSELRMTTPTEAALFRRWIDDPNTLPSEELRRKRQRDDNRSVLSAVAATTASSSSNAQPLPAATAAVRWLQRRLVVRCIAEDRPALLGMKFVVSAVNYKDDRMMLEPWHQAKPEQGGGDGNNGGESKMQAVERSTAIEVVPAAALETVLPRIGERGLIVKGTHRGQIATVVKRNKSANGDVAQVVVTIATVAAVGGGVTPSSDDDASHITLTPDEICLLS